MQPTAYYSEMQPTVYYSEMQPTACCSQMQPTACGLWNVVPLLFNGCVKLLNIGGNWNMLPYPLIQSIPNMLNG